MTRTGPGGHRRGQPSTDEAPLVAIVDDDASVRQSTRRLIRSFGYRAEAFASGEEFLASASAARTACLVLDVRMPPLDAGVKIARTPAPPAETFDDAVRERILEALRQTNGVVAGPRGAAARLGLKRTTLMSKMEKLGITPADVLPAPLRFPVAPSTR